ncbi:hypothetical protein SteCoe_17349 [Stentor coeruleus]|uniref:Uncharacterized protein n=1 Tax=Stentor coeruleus TaxID=5963 RepID=A0A1R2BZ83_9CILI|nr:hypothetical protein SteCoe_17349 [Stentor coeruleus]
MENSNSDYKVLSYNRKAMDLLRNNDFTLSLRYLAKAEKLLSASCLENPQKLYGLTLNNFSCYYKRTGNPAIALNFLKKALKISSKPPIDINTLAGTHLNICSLLSQINNHTKALSHALKALNLLKSKYLEDPSIITTLLVAHHNAGIEYEFLSYIPNALNIYTKGFKISLENLGNKHPLTKSLQQSINNCQFKSNTTHASPIKSLTNSTFKRSKDSSNKNFKSTKNSPQNMESKFKFNNDIVRFITGERLRPMHKKDKFRSKTRYNIKSLIKDLNGEGSEDVTSFRKTLPSTKDKAVETCDDLKLDMIDSKDNTATMESRRSVEKISIATQFEGFNKGFLKKLENSAAVTIQKHVRGFLAKRRFEIFKYKKQMREGIKQANYAKSKLRRLNRYKVYKRPEPEVVVTESQNTIVEVDTELVPIVYKEKLLLEKNIEE